MVLENNFYSGVSAQAEEKRSMESRQMSFQKLQQSSLSGSSNKRARDSGSSSKNKNDGHGSWGPLFKNRENFNNMHMF